MEEKELLKITDETGMEKEVEVVCYFTLNSNGKDYLVYTDKDSQPDEDGNVVTYISEVTKTDNSIELKEVTDENILNEIREVITEAINEGE